MSVSLPIPSFDDIQKLLSFWIDQEHKWFYFENEIFQIASHGEIINAPINTSRVVSSRDETNEIHTYSQSRIIGKICDVVSYPPSLLLEDVTVYTFHLTPINRKTSIENKEKHNKYGLVFSQITYYEPIDNIEAFMKSDNRIKATS